MARSRLRKGFGSIVDRSALGARGLHATRPRILALAILICIPWTARGANVTNVTSDTANGSYGVDTVIDVRVTFSASVTVTSTPQTRPQIRLETGAIDRYATYASGSPGTVLVFNYTVRQGDTSSDLAYTSTTALELNDGTINNTSGGAATLTLAAPGAQYSLNYNKNIGISTTALSDPQYIFAISNNGTAGRTGCYVINTRTGVVTRLSGYPTDQGGNHLATDEDKGRMIYTIGGTSDMGLYARAITSYDGNGYPTGVASTATTLSTNLQTTRAHEGVEHRVARLRVLADQPRRHLGDELGRVAVIAVGDIAGLAGRTLAKRPGRICFELREVVRHQGVIPQTRVG